MWQITNADDVVVGLPPGSTIPPRSTFTIVDHVWEPYQDGLPQDEQTAFLTGDLILNSFNDNRQARLYLKDGALELFLRDPDAVILDVAGNGGPAFVGGPDSGGRVRSMERNDEPGDGSLPEAWHACTEGGGDVNPAYAATIIATPGADNSPAGN